MEKPVCGDSKQGRSPSSRSDAGENGPLCNDTVPRQHTETLTTDSYGLYQYKIHMNTTLDSRNTAAEPSELPSFQNNLALTIENLSDSPVEVNALIANGRDFSSLSGLVKTVCGGYETDREKALALWQFLRQYLTFGPTRPGLDFHSPGVSLIRFLTGMGSGACGNFNGALALFAAAAGIPARTGSLSDGSHAVAELFFGGTRRYFDALYPNAQDQLKDAFIPDECGEISSYDQLCADSFLTRRAGSVEIGELAALFGGNDRWRSDWISAYSDPRDMSFTLKSGQRIVFYYDKFIGDKPLHQNLVSGEKRLSGEPCAIALGLRENKSLVIYRDDCPWPITGFSVKGKLKSGQLFVTVSAAGESKYAVTQPGEFCCEFNTGCKALSETCYHLELQIDARDADFIVDELNLVFQIYRPSLPELQSGDNTLELRTDQKRTLKITHLYRESSAVPPNPPALIDFAPGRPFRWTSADAVGYEFMLSDRADFAWPYAPVFQQHTTKPESDTDPSLILPSDKTYFWRARGKNADGVWSAWSRPGSFIWNAPPIPAGFALIRENRKLTLCWNSVGIGLTYAVYGSDEEGFTPSDKPREVWTNRTDSPAVREIYPANLICKTQNTELELTRFKRVYAQYRVRAFNAEGIGSLPTSCINLPCPFFLESSLEPAARVGAEYAVYVKSVRSLGKLLYNRLPDRPMYSGFHNAQKLIFSIKGAGWLQIRDYDGYLHGTPSSADKGLNHFILTVADQNGKRDILNFDLEVTEELL